ncbi:ribosomal RNA methyltransferase FtsJ domain-containing protein, partial [Mucidula mucida]
MFRPTIVACSKKSSKAWVARQGSDFFVKQRIAASYKSRSAFKLIEIDDNYDILRHKDVKVVVDLGAAPGGWSQVVSQRLGYGDGAPIDLDETGEVTRETFRPRASQKRVKPILPGNAYDPLNIDSIEEELEARESRGRGTIVAVDLLPMGPIPGSIQRLVYEKTRKRGPNQPIVDIVLSDMAPNLSGYEVRDLELSHQLCFATLEFVKRNLRASNEVGRGFGGALVLKHFASNDMITFKRDHLDPYFTSVRYVKPSSSRSESSESYFVCRGWNPDPEFRATFGFL